MGETFKRDDIVLIEKGVEEESRVTTRKNRSARTAEPLEKRYLRRLYSAVLRVMDR